MKKSTSIVIGIIAALMVIVGAAVYLSLSRSSNTSTNTTDTATDMADHGSPSNNTGAQTQNTSSAIDMTSKTNVDVAIRDMSFSPATIKIKKGTKVTWTNNDTVGHNVVATTPSSSGGLPSSHPLFSKGETFTHTFDTVGTFPYTCTPHPFMKGSVEVVE